MRNADHTEPRAHLTMVGKVCSVQSDIGKNLNSFNNVGRKTKRRNIKTETEKRRQMNEIMFSVITQQGKEKKDRDKESLKETQKERGGRDGPW
jgi:hypothetical protein